MIKKEAMEAWRDTCEMHFAAFQHFMGMTDGDIGLSLQLTTSYTSAFIKASQMQEQDKKQKEKMQLLLETDSNGLLN